MMAAQSNITLTVVVSGAPHQVKVNTHQKVAELIRDALRQAKMTQGDIAGWTLRFEGGAEISPSERIDDAGIAAGMTLFLDPDEGGGGEISMTLTLPDEGPEPPVLVDPAVSARKLARQLEDWDKNKSAYDERGWFLLERGELYVDVAFGARLPVGPFSDVLALPLAVRLDFHNYDIWAPSIRIIDPISRRWLALPRLRALDFRDADAAGTPLDAFVDGHPESGRVFLCKRGVREYHSHPEHTGDDWLLYRGEGYGTLAQLCEVLWRLTSRTVTGLNVLAQRVQVGDGASVNQTIELRQEDVDQLSDQIRAQMGQVQAAEMPPEVKDQLPPEVKAQIDAVIASQNA